MGWCGECGGLKNSGVAVDKWSGERGPPRDAMPVQLICPNLRCRKFLSVPDEVRGKLVKCQCCQTLFRVPDPAAKKPPARATPGSGVDAYR